VKTEMFGLSIKKCVHGCGENRNFRSDHEKVCSKAF
jgi:hypothetical protein